MTLYLPWPSPIQALQGSRTQLGVAAQSMEALPPPHAKPEAQTGGMGGWSKAGQHGKKGLKAQIRPEARSGSFS